MRVMRKPYKTQAFGIRTSEPLEQRVLSERCGSVSWGSKAGIRVYLETI